MNNIAKNILKIKKLNAVNFSSNTLFDDLFV